MHRLGDNKKALNELKNGKGEVDPYLLAQVNYKLGNYQEAADTYLSLFAQQQLDTYESNDILTNLLACSANDSQQIARVLAFASQLNCTDLHYEYYFNQSQTLLRGQHFQ